MNQISIKAFVRICLKLIPKRFLSPQTVSYNLSSLFFWAQNNKPLFSLLDKYVDPTGIFTCLDIGANCGYVGHAIASRFPKLQTLVSCEPIPNLMSHAVRLHKDLVLNKIYYCNAVSNQTGSIEIFLPNDNNIGWISAVQYGMQSNKSITVSTINIISLINIHQPDFIKIDIEGFEPALLDCISKLTGNNLPKYILVELGWGDFNPSYALTLQALSRFKAIGATFIDKTHGYVDLDFFKALKSTTDILIIKP